MRQCSASSWLSVPRSTFSVQAAVLCPVCSTLQRVRTYLQSFPVRQDLTFFSSNIKGVRTTAWMTVRTGLPAVEVKRTQLIEEPVKGAASRSSVLCKICIRNEADVGSRIGLRIRVCRNITSQSTTGSFTRSLSLSTNLERRKELSSRVVICTVGMPAT